MSWGSPLILFGLPGETRTSKKGLTVHGPVCRPSASWHNAIGVRTEFPMGDQGRQDDFAKVMLPHLDAV